MTRQRLDPCDALELMVLALFFIGGSLVGLTLAIVYIGVKILGVLSAFVVWA